MIQQITLNQSSTYCVELESVGKNKFLEESLKMFLWSLSFSFYRIILKMFPFRQEAYVNKLRQANLNKNMNDIKEN